jgi:hypothetical protein
MGETAVYLVEVTGGFSSQVSAPLYDWRLAVA